MKDNRMKNQAGKLERMFLLQSNITTRTLENILTKEEIRLDLKQKLREDNNEENYTKIAKRAKLHWRDSAGTLENIPIKEESRLERKEKLRKNTNEENPNYKKLLIQATPWRRYNCKQKVCDFYSNSSSGLQFHMKKVHFGGALPKFSCELCDFQSTKLMVKLHREAKHKIGLNKCGLCEFTSKWESSLYHHIRELHINPKSKQCDLCKYRTGSNTNMRNHVEAKHKGEECPVCGESIRNISI